jgi:hypothetical protein
MDEEPARIHGLFFHRVVSIVASTGRGWQS